MKATDKAETIKTAENRNTVKSLFLTPEKREIQSSPDKEKLNPELPAILIPGQKEFNEKRQEDIQKLAKEEKRKRSAPSGTPRSPAIVKASMKFVKKIFNNKKK